MDFTFYGHNCYLFKISCSSFLLTDPWFSKQGAFFGSWHQYPDNSQYADHLIDISKKSDKFFIYISHEHQDHFDKQFLSRAHSRSTFIIPKFKDTFLRDQLRSISVTDDRIMELSDESEYILSDSSKVKLFVTDTGVNHDSAILVKINEETFLNQNDCKIFDRLKSIEEPIHHYSVQFSGATSFPACYEYSSEKCAEISKTRRDAKLETVISAIQAIRPKQFYPAAGPAIFPFHDAQHPVNYSESIFTHQDFLDIKLKAQGIYNVSYLRPGDLGNLSRRDPIPPPSKLDIEAYNIKRDNVWESLNPQLSTDKLMSSINQRLEIMKEYSYPLQPLVVFEWGALVHERIVIDLNSKTIIDSHLGQDIYTHGVYTVKAEPKYFALMHDNNLRWQDISLSFRQRLGRTPDKFSNILNIFLFSDLTNLADALESTLFMKRERIMVAHHGDKFIIDRYCPHQGADLSTVFPDKNCMMACPRHQWKFDLQNNGKDEKHGESINAERISPLPNEC